MVNAHGAAVESCCTPLRQVAERDSFPVHRPDELHRMQRLQSTYCDGGRPRIQPSYRSAPCLHTLVKSLETCLNALNIAVVTQISRHQSPASLSMNHRPFTSSKRWALVELPRLRKSSLPKRPKG